MTSYKYIFHITNPFNMFEASVNYQLQLTDASPREG